VKSTSDSFPVISNVVSLATPERGTVLTNQVKIDGPNNAKTRIRLELTFVFTWNKEIIPIYFMSFYISAQQPEPSSLPSPPTTAPLPPISVKVRSIDTRISAFMKLILSLRLILMKILNPALFCSLCSI